MAWRFIQQDLQAGDILGPEDWNENVREYIEEINGAIDRDNIPAASIVVGGEVDSTVFNQISAAHLSAADFVASYGHNIQLLDVDTQSFQKILLSENITASSDELLICEASIQLDTAEGEAVYGPGTPTYNIYMCGALPVEAGAHVVETWVRLYHDKSSPDNNVTWYAPGQDLSPRIAEGTLLVNRRKR